MPSSITHTYIAKDVYNNLDKKIKKKIEGDFNNYLIYSFNADAFYFYKILRVFNTKAKKIQKFGTYVHYNKPNELLINITNKVKESKNSLEFSLLSAFITHYVADTILHPLINYKGNLLVNKYNDIVDTHFIIETYIDNYFVFKNEKVPYKKFKFYKMLNIEYHENVINLLNSAFEEVFGKGNMGDYYFNSIKYAKNFFHYLRYDPYRFKYYFYKFANIFAKRIFRDVRYLSYNFPLDNNSFYFNLDKSPWYNIYNPNFTSNKSFFELYDDVIKESTRIINEVYDYIFNDKKVDLEKLYGNKLYATGVVVK